jgi:hypothetical protein
MSRVPHLLPKNDFLFCVFWCFSWQISGFLIASGNRPIRVLNHGEPIPELLG